MGVREGAPSSLIAGSGLWGEQGGLCWRGPGSCQLSLSSCIFFGCREKTKGPIFSFLPFFFATVCHNVLLNVKGAKRTPWASLFVGEGPLLILSGEGEPAPKVVTLVSTQPSQSPPPLFLHYCRPLLCQSLRIHNMAHFRKAYFDRRIGTNAVAADREEKQTVPCAKRGRRERKKQSRVLASLALVPPRSALSRLSLKNDRI